MRYRLAILLGALLVACAGPAVAHATPPQFYASPAGSGVACTQAKPCSLATAFNAPSPSVQFAILTLAPGDYGSAASPLPALGTYPSTYGEIEGTPGAAMPQVYLTTSAITGSAYALNAGTDALSSIAITVYGSNDEGVAAASLARTSVTNVNGTGACSFITVAADSACVALASGAEAISYGGTDSGATAIAMTFDSDTFYAPRGTAAYLWPQNYTLTVNATDTIFSGATDDIDGSNIVGVSTHGKVDIVPSYDAYSKLAPSNLIANNASFNTDATAPTFVSSTTGDVHEANGSSTIDAGTDDTAGGDFDLGGGPRWIGSAMDIGAYEVDEMPMVDDVTLPSHNGVTADVDPDGLDTTVTLDYGPTPAYGSSETVNIGSGSTTALTLLPVSGFAPGATYYYDVTAKNSLGSGDSGSQSFDLSQERFASPTGTSADPCTIASPCDLTSAINNASSNEEVLVESGNYGSAASPLTTPLVSNSEITITGASPAPHVYLSTPGNWGLAVTSGFGRISGLDVFETSTGADGAVAMYGLLDHDLVVGSGFSACAVSGASLVVDTACFATGDGSALQANFSITPTTQVLLIALDHDTFVGQGAQGYGITAGIDGAPLLIAATDSIFAGAATSVYSAFVATDTVSALTMNIDHSDYATVNMAEGGTVSAPGSASNITAPALFTNVAGDLLTEAPGSPTIDTGTSDATDLSTDLNGNPRTIGPATDMGAYEAIDPPTISGVSTTGVGETALTVLGSVDPNYAATTVSVQYGTTTAYGQTTSATNIGSGLSAVPVTFALGSLVPGTSYHVRIVATNAQGTTKSSDFVLTTLAAPSAGGSSGGGSNSGASNTSTISVGSIGVLGSSAVSLPGVLTIASGVTVTGTTAAVVLTCGASALGCHGTLRLQIKSRKVEIVHGRHTVKSTLTTIGSVKFSLNGAEHATFKVHLISAAIKLLKVAKHQKLAVPFALTRSDGGANTTGTVTLALAKTPARR